MILSDSARHARRLNKLIESEPVGDCGSMDIRFSVP